ncbi:hypothetical protein FRC12_011226 [Ceratobasidium sp. 428]|nr:hypothetical protein FRC12_011226 [Ceratobasidium sp. 428]
MAHVRPAADALNPEPSVRTTRWVYILCYYLWSSAINMPRIAQEVKKSKITLLRDEITQLRNRVHELESGAANRSNTASPPNNYQPPPPVGYAASPTVSDNSTLSFLSNQLRDGSPSGKPFINTDLYQQPLPITDPAFSFAVPGGTGEGFQAPLVYGNVSSGWREVAPTNNGAVVLSPLDQPLTTTEILYYLDIILPFRLQCAFEIDITSFKESLDDPDPNNRPHEALLNAIALMACYYNQQLRGANRAQIFVEKTRRCLQDSLTGFRSRKVVQQIQAGHLLCEYRYAPLGFDPDDSQRVICTGPEASWKDMRR